MFKTLLTKTRTLLAVSTATIALLWPLLSLGSVYSPYDRTFQDAVRAYLPEYDYRWLIAQCKQESGLNPNAISWAGAKGYCQFMDETWRECEVSLGFIASPFDPQYNIRCAAWYMGEKTKTWNRRGRTAYQILELAQASYNCGTGCVLRAQRKCRNARLFSEMTGCLPRETREYPPKIKRYYDEFSGS